MSDPQELLGGDSSDDSISSYFVPRLSQTASASASLTAEIPARLEEREDAVEAAQDAHCTRQRGRCESTADPGGLPRKSAVFCLLLLVSHSCCFVVGPNEIDDADVDFGDSSSDVLPLPRSITGRRSDRRRSRPRRTRRRAQGRRATKDH